MTLASVCILFIFLFLFIGSWYLLSYLFAPSMENPDCSARITGNCGDTMELKMQVEDGRVVRIHHWTDGCTMSRSCIESAARLAQGKKLSELARLNMTHIIDDLGHIPDSHLHCAQLAEITLHAAADNYTHRHADTAIPQFQEPV